MPDTVSPELQSRVLDRIDDEEIVRLASDLIRIPSFTTEETPCAEWLAGYLDGQGLAVVKDGMRIRSEASRTISSSSIRSRTRLWSSDGTASGMGGHCTTRIAAALHARRRW